MTDDICYYIWKIFEELNHPITLLSPKLADKHALPQLQTVDELSTVSSDGGLILGVRTG